MGKILLLSLLMISCSYYQPANRESVYDGRDVREEFLSQYQGTFLVPHSSKSDIDGQNITFNKDGTYVIQHSLQRITDSSSAQVRTAKCVVEEIGRVFQVRKIPWSKGPVQMGLSTINNVEEFSGYLILQPVDSRVIQAQTVEFNPNGEGERTSATPFTDLEIKRICSRGSERQILIREFLEDALLLAEKTPRLDGSGLKDRLVVKKGREWLWFTGATAQAALKEASEHGRKGLAGLQMFDLNIEHLYHANKKLKFSIEIQMAESLNVLLGANISGVIFPFAQLSGKLEGISYNPSSGQVVMHLTDYNFEALARATDESSELNHTLAERISEAWKALQSHAEKINSLDKKSEILTMQLPTRYFENATITTKPSAK